MKDPNGVMEKQGPNTQYPDMIRFTKNDQVARMKPIIESYLVESMGYADAGIKPPKQTSDVQLPDELLEALEFDPELADAFYGLTPGRQKSYLINLNSAKKAETRISRIAKFRDKILAGNRCDGTLRRYNAAEPRNAPESRKSTCVGLPICDGVPHSQHTPSPIDDRN